MCMGLFGKKSVIDYMLITDELKDDDDKETEEFDEEYYRNQGLNTGEIRLIREEGYSEFDFNDDEDDEWV